MNHKGRIYVDLDDVVAATARMFLKLLEREYGRRVEYDDIIAYDLGRSLEFSPEELNDFMRAAHEVEALASIDPIDGAIEALQDWVDRGYRVEVVTGRPSVTAVASQEWLDDRGVPHHSLTFVDKYAWEDEAFENNTAVPFHELTAHGYCLAVEDSADVASRLATILDAPVALIDKPWNRQERVEDDHEDGQITRCRDWGEILDRFYQP